MLTMLNISKLSMWATSKWISFNNCTKEWGPEDGWSKA